MSGGSYNYLCYKEPDVLISHVGDVRDMYDRLNGLGYAGEAARETARLLRLIKEFNEEAAKISENLSDVWKAVEWWDSCDTAEDGLKNALEKYSATI